MNKKTNIWVSTGKVKLIKIGEGMMNNVFLDDTRIIRIPKTKTNFILHELSSEQPRSITMCTRHSCFESMDKEIQEFNIIKNILSKYKTFISPQGLIIYLNNSKAIILVTPFYKHIELQPLSLSHLNRSKFKLIIDDLYNLNVSGYCHYDIHHVDNTIRNIEMDEYGNYYVIDFDRFRSVTMLFKQQTVWSLSRILHDIVNLYSSMNSKENTFIFLKYCIDRLHDFNTFYTVSKHNHTKITKTDISRFIKEIQTSNTIYNALCKCKPIIIMNSSYSHKKYIHHLYTKYVYETS